MARKVGVHACADKPLSSSMAQSCSSIITPRSASIIGGMSSRCRMISFGERQGRATGMVRLGLLGLGNVLRLPGGVCPVRHPHLARAEDVALGQREDQRVGNLPGSAGDAHPDGVVRTAVFRGRHDDLVEVEMVG